MKKAQNGRFHKEQQHNVLQLVRVPQLESWDDDALVIGNLNRVCSSSERGVVVVADCEAPAVYLFLSALQPAPKLQLTATNHCYHNEIVVQCDVADNLYTAIYPTQVSRDVWDGQRQVDTYRKATKMVDMLVRAKPTGRATGPRS